MRESACGGLCVVSRFPLTGTAGSKVKDGGKGASQAGAGSRHAPVARRIFPEVPSSPGVEGTGQEPRLGGDSLGQRSRLDQDSGLQDADRRGLYRDPGLGPGRRSGGLEDALIVCTLKGVNAAVALGGRLVAMIVKKSTTCPSMFLKYPAAFLGSPSMLNSINRAPDLAP